jgi:hypothetical protein
MLSGLVFQIHGVRHEWVRFTAAAMTGRKFMALAMNDVEIPFEFGDSRHSPLRERSSSSGKVI